MVHRNARLGLHSRLLPCRRVEDEGWTVRAAAEAAGVSRQTASKWRRRLALEVISGLADRSSARRRPPERIGGRLLRRIVGLRQGCTLRREVVMEAAIPSGSRGATGIYSMRSASCRSELPSHR